MIASFTNSLLFRSKLERRHTMATRVRSIREIIEMIKQEDPGTSLNENFLRNIVKDGRIPSYQYGNKTLISYEDVEAFFDAH